MNANTRKRKPEGAALSFFAFDPNFTAVFLNEFFMIHPKVIDPFLNIVGC